LKVFRLANSLADCYPTEESGLFDHRGHKGAQRKTLVELVMGCLG